MDESKFCTDCGKPIEPGMQFCPQCGKVVSGSQADVEFQEQQAEMVEYFMQGRRSWLMFIMLIYIIPVIIVSIAVIVNASNTADIIWASDEFQKWMDTHHISWTLNDVKNYVTYIGAIALASGICALGSFILLYLKKYWGICVALCFIAAFLCFWSFFGVIIGILVAWMIIGVKPVFQE